MKNTCNNHILPLTVACPKCGNVYSIKLWREGDEYNSVLIGECDDCHYAWEIKSIKH